MSNATFELNSAQNNRQSKKGFQSLGNQSDAIHANGGIQSAKKLFDQPKSQQQMLGLDQKHYAMKTASGRASREKSDR